MSPPDVIVIAGPNGAGKSTVAPFLLRELFGVVEFVNADTIALGLSAFAPEQAAIRAGRVMLSRIHELSEEGKTFAFETTLASRSFAPRIRRLLSSGYDFHLLYLWLPSPDFAVARVQQRVRAGGHDVPAEVVRRRYERSIRNFFALYRPLASQWQMLDASTGARPRLLAAGSGEADAETTVYDPVGWMLAQGIRDGER